MGYIIGILLFWLLYEVGMKIMRFINPYPPDVPDDIEYDETEKCKICVNEKTYDCTKILHIWKTYGYDEDCNVLEMACTYIKYDFQKPFLVPYSQKITVFEENKEEVECYLSNDWKGLICLSPIKSERIVEYRKAWKNKRLSAQN